MALATELNLLDAALPSRVTAAMHTTAISATSNAYSTSEAPRSLSAPRLQPGLSELVADGHGSSLRCIAPSALWFVDGSSPSEAISCLAHES